MPFLQAALCHAERFVVLGATLVTGRSSRLSQSSASNETNFSSVEIAEVIKISEKFCLFFENVNEA
jgi:hypothetical protein